MPQRLRCGANFQFALKITPGLIILPQPDNALEDSSRCDSPRWDVVAILPQPDNALEVSFNYITPTMSESRNPALAGQCFRGFPLCAQRKCNDESQSCLSRTMLQRQLTRKMAMYYKTVAILPQPDNALEDILYATCALILAVAILPQPDNALEGVPPADTITGLPVAILPQPDNALEVIKYRNYELFSFVAILPQPDNALEENPDPKYAPVPKRRNPALAGQCFRGQHGKLRQWPGTVAILPQPDNALEASKTSK